MPTGAMERKERGLETTTAVRASLQDSTLKKIHMFCQREQVMGYTLIGPAFILLGVLVAWPFMMALYFSVTDSWVGQPGTFIGLLQRGVFQGDTRHNPGAAPASHAQI